MADDSIPVLLPDLGTDNDPIRMSVWLVELGETVLEGDRIAEVVIPGASFDVSAPTNGCLSRIERNPGDELEADTILGWITPETCEESVE